MKRRLSSKSREACIQFWGPQHKNDVGYCRDRLKEVKGEKIFKNEVIHYPSPGQFFFTELNQLMFFFYFYLKIF